MTTSADTFLPVEVESQAVSALSFLIGTAAAILLLCAPAIIWAAYRGAF